MLYPPVVDMALLIPSAEKCTAPEAQMQCAGKPTLSDSAGHAETKKAHAAGETRGLVQ
jgi:hypothetical protein